MNFGITLSKQIKRYKARRVVGGSPSGFPP